MLFFLTQIFNMHLLLYIVSYLEMEFFFVSKYGNIYIKRCRLKKLNQEKKHFEKSLTQPDLQPKKTAKNSDLTRMAIFTQVFYESDYNKDFFKRFFSWLGFFNMHLLMYILPYLETNFFFTYKGGCDFLNGPHKKLGA